MHTFFLPVLEKNYTYSTQRWAIIKCSNKVQLIKYYFYTTNIEVLTVSDPDKDATHRRAILASNPFMLASKQVYRCINEIVKNRYTK